MREPGLSYAAITPARNEAANLRRLAACLRRQTVPPAAWVVVDDGSTDESLAVVEAFAVGHPWARAIRSPGATANGGPLTSGRRQGRDVVAFTAGVKSLDSAPGVVVKLDADVSFEDDFFELLLSEFERDAHLGIAGGICYELEDGAWCPQHVTGSHVRGATRAYRWPCFEQVIPLEEGLGWDGIDEVKAEIFGWKVRSIGYLPFRHHRRVGQRDGAWRAWSGQGAAAHFMGYRLSYLSLRTLYHAKSDLAAFGMLVGYLHAGLKRRPTYSDAVVRNHLRSRQSLRMLPTRLREARGRT